MKNVSKGLEVFLDYLRECEQDYRIAASDEQHTNDLTQDILHSLELEQHDRNAYARFARQLRDVRRERRVAKDAIAELTPIIEWAEANKGVVKELERVLPAQPARRELAAAPKLAADTTNARRVTRRPPAHRWLFGSFVPKAPNPSST